MFPTKDRALKLFIAWTVAALASGFVGYATAEDLDRGQLEYRSSCAACHGTTGKGDGPLSREMKKQPSNLTILAKKNNGVFPFNFVYRVIDGRDLVAGHGTREMPIWGYRFVPSTHYDSKLVDDYIYAPPLSPEAAVHMRILAVIDFLNRIQSTD